VSEAELKKPELDLAHQVIESLAAGFDPKQLTSEYRRDLKALLEAKLAGQEIARPDPVPETPVVDLMEALKRSIADVQRHKAAGAKPAKAPANKRAPTRRSA
jgi:DNA end-binding protein Ku